MQEDRDIVRINVTIGGVKTSVSIDGRMFFYLGQKMETEERCRAWVRETMDRLQSEWAAADVGVGERVRANTGLSRAVQREVLDELLRDAPFVVNKASEIRESR